MWIVGDEEHERPRPPSDPSLGADGPGPETWRGGIAAAREVLRRSHPPDGRRDEPPGETGDSTDDELAELDAAIQTATTALEALEARRSAVADRAARQEAADSDAE